MTSLHFYPPEMQLKTSWLYVDLGPRLHSFLKDKVTFTLREVKLRHNTKHLIIIFRFGD